MNKYTFVIFGRIIHVNYFLEKIREKKWPTPYVFCNQDDEYLRDKRLLTEYGLWCDLEDASSKGLCYLSKHDSMNGIDLIEKIKKIEGSIFGISISSRDILKKPLIELFGENILNLHDSYLPNERGGALNTWRILNRINSVGNTIHFLTEGIDSGDIVLRAEADLHLKRPKPIDYLYAEIDNCKNLLDRLLDILERNEPLPRIPQDHDLSLYFPRQFTEFNALIDWNMPAEEVEIFIRAFSKPYPGAYSYLKDESKVHILDCELDKALSKKVFHPYCNGLVVTEMTNGSVRIIAGRRALLIKELSYKGLNIIRPSDLLKVRMNLSADQGRLYRDHHYFANTKMMAKNELDNQK